MWFNTSYDHLAMIRLWDSLWTSLLAGALLSCQLAPPFKALTLLLQDLLNLKCWSLRLHWALGITVGAKKNTFLCGLRGCKSQRCDPCPHTHADWGWRWGWGWWKKFGPLSHIKPSGYELWIMTLLSPAFKTSAEGKGECIIHTIWVLS